MRWYRGRLTLSSSQGERVYCIKLAFQIRALSSTSNIWISLLKIEERKYGKAYPGEDL
jgi:hypothetical protein